MIIPVLSELENREQWLGLMRRERPYAQIQDPHCRLDLQTTYLSITLLGSEERSALRFTLGSRTSLEPVWQLISGCNWSLTAIVEGLQAQEFKGNARDQALSGWSPDLSVRRSFPREAGLFSEKNLGLLNNMSSEPASSEIDRIINMLTLGQLSVEKESLDRLTLLSVLTESPGSADFVMQGKDAYQIKHPDLGTVLLKPTDNQLDTLD